VTGVPYIYCYAAIQRLRPLLAVVERDWLSSSEQRAFGCFSDLARRETWLAGRFMAKRMIASLLEQGRGVSQSPHERTPKPSSYNMHTSQPATRYSDIEISSAGVRPQVNVAGRTLDCSLSIAHTSRGVLVALSTMPGVSSGVDLVEPLTCGPGFAEAWFTPAERRWLASSDRLWPAIVWAIKEAVYKAANNGEPFDPRLIETIPAENNAFVCTLNRDGRTLSCHLAACRTPTSEFAVFAWGLSQYLLLNRLPWRRS
jgi:phosphopantetheinyl transferase